MPLLVHRANSHSFQRRHALALAEAHKYDDQFTETHIGPLQRLTLAHDTHSGGDLAVIVAMGPDWTFAIYLDDTNSFVSCGNAPGRWRIAE